MPALSRKAAFFEVAFKDSYKCSPLYEWPGGMHEHSRNVELPTPSLCLNFVEPVPLCSSFRSQHPTTSELPLFLFNAH